jgi:hypothetical protein
MQPEKLVSAQPAAGSVLCGAACGGSAMPFEDPWFRDGKTMSPLDWERRMYERTKNPLHAWRAYQICSELMRGGIYGCDSLPEWVLDYFDATTLVIQDLFNESFDGNVPQRIADGFGFKRAGQGVRATAFTNFDLEHRDLMLATDVRRLVNAQPTQSREAVIADVAERHGLSIETVWDAWTTWRDFLEERKKEAERADKDPGVT